MSNQPESSVFIISVLDIVHTMLERFETYAADTTKPGHAEVAAMLAYRPSKGDSVQGINMTSVALLTHALMIEQMAHFAHWEEFAGAGDQYEVQLAKMIRGYHDLGSQVANKLYIDVVDIGVMALEDNLRMLRAFEKTWHVWYVRLIGLSIMLEKGPDYRILDWDRRMRAAAELTEMDELPPEAWRPDAEARRFAQLLKKAQQTNTITGFEATKGLDRSRKLRSVVRGRSR